MWMTDVSQMCRQHLLGEHKEIHQLMGSLKKKMNLNGYVEKNCIEISSIISRHQTLVDEMIRRGYNHHSPIEPMLEFEQIIEYLTDDIRNFKIDKESSKIELLQRCTHCQSNFNSKIT